MTRETIAVDIDDVIADTTDALRLYVNEVTGLSLTAADYQVPATYWGYYEHVWTAAGITDHSHIHAFHERMGADQSNIHPISGSFEVLTALKNTYDFIAVTSRELSMEEQTNKWIENYFKGIFKQVVLLGHVKTAHQTKGEVCAVLGAGWLIDDNIGHCETTKPVGVKPLLYGDYGWQTEFKGGMDRCRDWPAVRKYFSDKN